MKKAITLALSLALVTPAHANEIPGTRVEGQGAVCAEGQGKALEVNIALKKEFSYCIELPKPEPTPVVTAVASPTPTTTVSSGSTITTTPSPSPILTTETTSETTTVVVEPTPTASPKPIAPPTLPTVPEKSNVVIADVTAKTVVVREETDTEFLNRWLFIWSNWFNELLAWFASLG